MLFLLFCFGFCWFVVAAVVVPVVAVDCCVVVTWSAVITVCCLFSWYSSMSAATFLWRSLLWLLWFVRLVMVYHSTKQVMLVDFAW